MTKLTHLDDQGAARMVDVSAKAATEREATAEATIALSAEAFAAIASGGAPKGDALATARIAGIMAAKKTSELIPLCHPLALTRANVDFEMIGASNTVRILASVKTTGQTGVEMEALTAASIAALTVYDMIKAIDKSAAIEGVRLLAKSGGKSGDFVAPTPARDEKPKPFVPAAAGSNRGRAKAAVLSNGIASPTAQQKAGGEREAFRAFMLDRRLRATEWAKEAGVPPSQIYAYLTGRARALPSEVAEKLARTAHVRVEDMFR